MASLVELKVPRDLGTGRAGIFHCDTLNPSRTQILSKFIVQLDFSSWSLESIKDTNNSWFNFSSIQRNHKGRYLTDAEYVQVSTNMEFVKPIVTFITDASVLQEIQKFKSKHDEFSVKLCIELTNVYAGQEKIDIKLTFSDPWHITELQDESSYPRGWKYDKLPLGNVTNIMAQYEIPIETVNVNEKLESSANTYYQKILYHMIGNHVTGQIPIDGMAFCSNERIKLILESMKKRAKIDKLVLFALVYKHETIYWMAEKDVTSGIVVTLCAS